jgi:hypothetical protein
MSLKQGRNDEMQDFILAQVVPLDRVLRDLRFHHASLGL